jgi:leucyl aminopeptidase
MTTTGITRWQHRPSAPPSGVARDWHAEIDAAISSVTRTGTSPWEPISLSTDNDAARHIEFLHSDGASSPSGWLPFHAELGELSAHDSTLRVGLGAEAASTVETVRHAAATASAYLTGGSVDVHAPPGLMRAVIDGLATTRGRDRTVRLQVHPGELDHASQGLLDADVVHLAKRLVSAPGNVLTPEQAKKWCVGIAERAGLDCTVRDQDRLVAEGFGGLTAIGAGSTYGPCLVHLTYRGATRGPVLVLVGKGITFDSGGLSLKSPTAMQPMRLDVAGAATVLAVMASLRRSRIPMTVHAVLPFAENLPGPGAVRPGDVVTAWNGTQIQILDTDFEGRVVLADALAYASALQPDMLVDLATLTYQAEIALGPDIAAVFGRSDHAVDMILDAAGAAGEPMWRLPWADRYVDQVRTSFGVRNHPLHASGRAITAALMLGEFVPPELPWVHCDMTGPAWSGDASQDGGTGFGARTLRRLIAVMADNGDA